MSADFDRVFQEALSLVGSAPTPWQQTQTRHVVTLALEEPAIRVVWIRPNSDVLRLIGPTNALARCRSRWIAIHPCRTVGDVAGALHEIGHVRSYAQTNTKLQSELDAWRWAAMASLEWDERWHSDMRGCLQTYINEATRPDVWDVDLIERFVEHDGLDAILEARRAAKEAAERQAFVHKHGARVFCQDRGCAFRASRELHGLLLCQRHYVDRSIAEVKQSRIRSVEREITALKVRRDHDRRLREQKLNQELEAFIVKRRLERDAARVAEGR